MAILTYEDIKAIREHESDFGKQMAEQEYKCAACGRDQSNWTVHSVYGPQFTDGILEGAAHELICTYCASDLRFNMNRAENMRRIRREQELREEYINSQLARHQDDGL